MEFQFASPTKILCGAGIAARTGEWAATLGHRAFAVVSHSIQEQGLARKIVSSLMHHGIAVVEHPKSEGEPTVEMTDAAAEHARAENCDMVLSLGGGATIDLGKAVSGLVTNGGSIGDYLEGVGAGREVTLPGLPQLAIPTTAGAGAETTRNAVISSKTGRFKKSFRSPYLYPNIALLDAELTLSLPPQQTAYSGMDTITQLIESYLTKRATPMTDALALQGLELAFRSIREVFRDGSQIEYRKNMLLASSLSGICLANAGLGLAHGFASGLGALYDIPHGKACAILLPHALKFNRCACRDKIVRIARLTDCGSAHSTCESADELIRYIQDLNAEFSIPCDLRSFQIPKSEHDLLIEMSMGNSMSGNPITITPSVALTILESLT